MKILIGADTYPPDVNGAATFAARLSAALVERGHEVHVLCPSTHRGDATQLHEGVILHRVAARRWPQRDAPGDGFRVALPRQAARRADEVVRTLVPDAVHVQAHFVVGRHAARAAARHGARLVATNHFMPENLIPHLPVPAPVSRQLAAAAWRDLRRVFAFADVVTAPTPRAVDLLTDATGLEAQAISCGIDREVFGSATRRRPADAPVRVLFVGRLEPEKHVDDLIAAWDALPAELGVELDIVGDGTLRRDLQRRLETTRRPALARLRGAVGQAELVQAYADADVFAMPGTAELQSLVTLEAMSAGVPVVAAAAMALPHLAIPGHTGDLVPPRDVAALSAALERLVRCPDLRRQLGEGARDLARRHDLATTVEAFERLYAGAAGRFGARSRYRAASVRSAVRSARPSMRT